MSPTSALVLFCSLEALACVLAPPLSPFTLLFIMTPCRVCLPLSVCAPLIYCACSLPGLFRSADYTVKYCMVSFGMSWLCMRSIPMHTVASLRHVSFRISALRSLTRGLSPWKLYSSHISSAHLPPPTALPSPFPIPSLATSSKVDPGGSTAHPGLSGAAPCCHADSL